MQELTAIDLIIFFGSLVAVMIVGLWAGRKEEDSSDFFLAGNSARWWGVAGSIFGSNVSANHIVGMMAIGFSVGFAQSHFEISAIAGLLLMCFGFLPVYRKLKVFTLSEYMSRRYGDESRVAYAVIMLVVIVVIQMVPGFYIGSRSLNILLKGDTGHRAIASAPVNEQGQVTAIEISFEGEKYGTAPTVTLDPPPANANSLNLTAVLEGETVTRVELSEPATGYDPAKPAPAVVFKGGDQNVPAISPGDVDPKWFVVGILAMAIITGLYTIFGGLKAVIMTDVLQSALMLIGALVVGWATFSQPEIGGWTGMRELDAAAENGKMHLYLPASHGQLPWTGVLSGLLILHFYYWGTNQFIVQRALAARTAREARFGTIVAGFLKLLIPFMSIGGGIAAYYLFKQRNLDVPQDAAFTVLLKTVVAPIFPGLVGLVAAGLIGAILSSLDSMLNSGATIMTIDFYKRYVNPKASEHRLVFMGRLWIGIFLVAAVALCILTMDPNSEKGFFLMIATHQSKLIAGVVVAFALGMFWKRATRAGAIVAIVAGVVFSYGLPPLYAATLGSDEAFFGPQLNFMHAVFLAAIFSTILHVVVSLMTQPDEEKSQLTWTGLGGHDPSVLKRLGLKLALSLAIFAVLGVLLYKGILPPLVAGLTGGLWAWLMFLMTALAAVKRAKAGVGDLEDCATALWKEDRFWAGVLAGTAVFLMYYFV